MAGVNPQRDDFVCAAGALKNRRQSGSNCDRVAQLQLITMFKTSTVQYTQLGKREHYQFNSQANVLMNRSYKKRPEKKHGSSKSSTVI